MDNNTGCRNRLLRMVRSRNSHWVLQMSLMKLYPRLQTSSFHSQLAYNQSSRWRSRWKMILIPGTLRSFLKYSEMEHLHEYFLIPVLSSDHHPPVLKFQEVAEPLETWPDFASPFSSGGCASSS